MTTFYLAFDVGIINLAYCFSKYDKELSIIDWNVIDFSREKQTCNHLIVKKKSSRICGKTATYTNNSKTNSYCDIHHKEKNDKTIKTKKIQKPTLQINIERLLASLDNLFTNILTMPYDISKYANNINILIENQPVFLIPTMKTYSVIIYGFFAYKKIQFPNIINNIRFINAGTKTSDKFISILNNKLITQYDIIKIFKKNYIIKCENEHKKKLKTNKKAKMKQIKAYDIRKEFSINLASTLIENIKIIPNNHFNIVSITNFELTNKKDDLSDALLYVLHAIFVGVDNKE